MRKINARLINKFKFKHDDNQSYKHVCEQANILLTQNEYLKQQLTQFQLNIYHNYFNPQLYDSLIQHKQCNTYCKHSCNKITKLCPKQ